jgi:hypothetical protein
MILADPDVRPTAAEILEHEFFSCDQNVISEMLSVNVALCCPMRDVSNLDENENKSASSWMADFQMGANYLKRFENAPYGE